MPWLLCRPLVDRTLPASSSSSAEYAEYSASSTEYYAGRLSSAEYAAYPPPPTTRPIHHSHPLSALPAYPSPFRAPPPRHAPLSCLLPTPLLRAIHQVQRRGAKGDGRCGQELGRPAVAGAQAGGDARCRPGGAPARRTYRGARGDRPWRVGWRGGGGGGGRPRVAAAGCRARAGGASPRCGVSAGGTSSLQP